MDLRPETQVVSSFSSHLVVFWGVLTLKAKETTPKTNIWYCIKLKDFCSVKETINKMKRQPTEWEKIFAKYISDKEAVLKVYKALIQLINNNKNQSGGSGKRI